MGLKLNRKHLDIELERLVKDYEEHVGLGFVFLVK